MTASHTPDGLTAQLAHEVARLEFAQLPADIVERARLCLLDWYGVALAGRDEKCAFLVLAEMLEAGGAEQASAIGQQGRLPAASAAMVNATAAHALDYDDASTVLIGHPSVPLAAGLMAVAEKTGASGIEVLTAFVAGYELVCKLGVILGAGHYQRGHHTTSTAGTISTAAACAKLLGLDEQGIAQAMAVASTQASGNRAMFGTMLKPLQVGFASSQGVLAALLAKRGLQGPDAALEMPAGMLAVLGVEPPARLPRASDGYFLRENLFKFHASCLLANAPAAAGAALRDEHGVTPKEIVALRITVDRGAQLICDDPAPESGLAMKFSLRAAAALALAGHDTGTIAAFSDANAADAAMIRLRDLFAVTYIDAPSETYCRIDADLADGRTITVECDAAQMPAHLGELRQLLEAKFTKLAMPALGQAQAMRLQAVLTRFERLDNCTKMGSLSQPQAGEK